MTALSEAYQALYRVHTNVHGDLPYAGGICFALEYELTRFQRPESMYEEAHELVLDLMREWPAIYRRSGVFASSAYPVGGSAEFIDEREAGTLWANPRRLALLDWLLAQLAIKVNVEAYRQENPR